jgi:uncharacterized membrane protein
MIYWISTSLLSAMLFASALSYVLHQGTIDGIRDLGFPDHFRIQLAVLKLAAALVLILPFFSAEIKEWAYIGAALFFITAIVAHYAHGDPWYLNAINVIFILILLVSRQNLTA